MPPRSTSTKAAAARGARRATRQAMHDAALRERLLRGAAVAFARLGYAQARVEDIAAETGVSRPTFYRIFDGKDAAFLALSELHHATIRDRLRQAVDSSDDPFVQLERAVERFLRWRAELGPVGRVLDLDARSPGTLLGAHRADTLRFVGELLARGIEAAGRPAPDGVLVRALIAAAENVADELFGEPEVPEREIQRAKAIVLRLATAALAAPGDPVPELPLAAARRAPGPRRRRPGRRPKP